MATAATNIRRDNNWDNFTVSADDLRARDAWLAACCVLNALSLLMIVFRSLVRYKTDKKFHIHDWVMVLSGILLICPLWVGQAGVLVVFNDVFLLHDQSVSKRSQYITFNRMSGGYYLVCSAIKISMCFCILRIIPQMVRYLRIALYALGGGISMIGIGAFVSWNLKCCAPSSINIFAMFLAWVVISTILDVVLIFIPIHILYLTKLQQHQRIALTIVFGTCILGTVCCLCRIYSVLAYRRQETILDSPAILELMHKFGANMMLYDLEILMYTIGVTMPAVSKKIVSLASRISTERSHIYFSFWKDNNPSTLPRRTKDDKPPLPASGALRQQDGPYIELVEQGQIKENRSSE